MTDTLQANYLTLNPDGTIGALFSGGVQMVEALSAGYGASHALGWLDAAGIVREYIQAAGVPVSGPTVRHDVFINCQPDANDNAFLDLLANESGAAGASTIQFGVRDSTQNPRFGTVIDSNGASSFLQLLSAQQLQLAGGTPNMPFAGTSGPVTVVVNHGLGRVPVRVTATYDYAGSAGLFVYAQARDANTITFRGVATAAVAGNVGFDWIAIG